MFTKAHTVAMAAAAFSNIVAASPITLNATMMMDGLLMKRDLSEVICGFYPSADGWETENKNEPNLRGKGDQNVHVAAGSCSRVGCYNTSGVYVCNDQDSDLDVPMNEVVDLLDYLGQICLHKKTDDGGQDGNGSGRVTTTDRGGYNVNIGYCNGNDSPSIPPSGYGWPGPNGTPFIQCGKEGQPPCEGTGCLEGTIVVESQEAVGCADYLGAGYIEAGATYIYSTASHSSYPTRCSC
ncbi:uncharacterized protein LTR77_004038 [Saxophila tyrrhenica]|uniref:Uncharacterized protein n=1 Tax=Saxophila tyrrhenica TaxID=1690608 RepID=A0AAV9PBV9_9PEZI|nr:hypothetical protein LTR77_004038 [Saxophila tyrrhenica]